MVYRLGQRVYRRAPAKSSYAARWSMVTVRVGVLAVYICALMGAGLALHNVRLANYATAISSSDIFTLTNEQRLQAGSPKLTENAQLMMAAAHKAADMFAENYWAHDSPSGETPWDFITNAGYAYTAAAENLAKNFDTSSQVIAAWMNSPEHRTNLLNARYQDVGIAVVNGTLLGEQTTLVVMEFGQPVKLPVLTAPIQTNSAKPVVPTASNSKPATPVSSVVHAAPVTVTPKAPVISRQYPVNPDPFASLAAAKATVRAVNWAQWSLLAVCGVIFTIQYTKLTFVWRYSRRTSWHIRLLQAYPRLQVNLVAFASVLMVGSAAGVMK